MGYKPRGNSHFVDSYPHEQQRRAGPPRGPPAEGPFEDISASELRATADMLATIRGVFERYGFEPLETPFLEYADALGKFLPDQDRPNEGVFSFQDEDDQWLSLRYDLTAPLARYVAENHESCRSRSAATGRAGCSATRSRGPAASASSCSSTPTPSAQPGRRRRRGVHDGGRCAGGAGDRARQYVDQVQQPQICRGISGEIGLSLRSRRRARYSGRSINLPNGTRVKCSCLGRAEGRKRRLHARGRARSRSDQVTS